MEKTVWSSPAGKKRLSKKLAAMIPEHKTYVEPFAGSAAVLFAKDKADTEVLNDMDPEIAFAFKAIVSMTDAEFKSIGKKNFTGSKEAYKKVYTSWKNKETLGKVDRLHRFLYLSHFSFGKLRGSSLSPGADGIESQTVGKVEKARERLKGVKVFSEDYRKVCKRFDGKDTFFFLDPPYVGSDALNRTDSEGGGQGTGEKAFDEEAFHGFLKTIKGKFLVTYGVTGKMNWPGFKTFIITSPRTLANIPGVKGPKTLKHLVISNYKVSKSDIKKAFGDDVVVQSVVKGFPESSAEAGIHFHELNEERTSTKVDGKHTHVYVIDGKEIVTSEDGEHAHEIPEHENSRVLGGEHFHTIELADGTKLETEISGDYGHEHALQEDTTAFDGIHPHKLKIPGGQVINSKMPGDYFDDGPRKVAATKAGSVLSRLETFKVRTGVYFSDGNLYVDGVSDEVAKSLESAVGRMLPSSVASSIRIIKGRPTEGAVEVADLVIRMRKDFSVVEMEPVEKAGFDSEDGVPGVLTWKAVEFGLMPPEGESFLPPAIEAVIPQRFQYWKAEGDEARHIRDSLFDAAIVTKDSVASVDGESCLVVTKRFSIDPSDVDHGITPIRRDFNHEVSALVEKGCVKWVGAIANNEASPLMKNYEGSILIVDARNETPRIVAFKASTLSCEHIIAVNDSVGARHELAKYGKPFVVKKSAMAGILFMSNADIAKANVEFVGDGCAELGDHSFDLRKQDWDGHSLWHLDIGGEAWTLQEDPSVGGKVTALKSEGGELDGEVRTIDSGRATFIDKDVDSMSIRFDGRTMIGVRKMHRVGGSSVWNLEPGSAGKVEKSYDVRLIKADGAEDERFLFGVVLEPNEVDSQDDTISLDEIRGAAHDFMKDHQNIGVQHEELTRKVHILESYLSPVDFSVGKQKIKKGTWLLAVKVLDDSLWAAVKRGEFTGFSIGGSAVRSPEN